VSSRRPDSMEDDLAAIFRVAHSPARPERDFRAPLILLLLMVFAAFAFVASRLVPKPDAQQDLPATAAPTPLPTSAYVATTRTVPAPAAPEASPASGLQAELAVTPLLESRPPPKRNQRRRNLQLAAPTQMAAIIPSPAGDGPKVTQERLSAPALDQKGETRDITIKPIEVRSSRLEAVDAIRTLRLR
jgi:hypothetical protein